MLLALLASADAYDPLRFVDQLEAPPFFVFSCPDAEVLSGWTAELPSHEQLDPSQPVHLAMIPGPGGFGMVYSVGVTDEQAWLQGEAERLLGAGFVLRNGRWEGPQGNLHQLTASEGRAETRSWLVAPPDAPLDVAGSIEAADLERAAALGGNCVTAFGVQMPTGEGLTVLLEFTEEDRYEGLFYGSAIQGAGSTFVGREPFSPAALRAVDQPDLYVRANLELQPLAEAWAAGQGPQARMGAALLELERAGVRLGSGTEVALWMNPEAPELLAVSPVRRPRKAARVLRRLERAGEGQLDEQGVLLVASEQPFYLAAEGRLLYASTSAEHLAAMRRGEGERWYTGEDLESPGVSLRFSESAWEAALAASGRRDPALADMPGFDLHLVDEGEAMRFVLSAPGYSAWAASALQRQLAPEEVDPIGHPPSTEALSVLMSIANAEEQAYEAQGRYLPYSGGPREVSELDGDVVAWEGIPELGIGGMDTACRYEVKLSIEGYTAHSICDEDGDGRHAITVMSPGGRPHRVTPQEVR